jgi:RNA polymerase sigma-70 factor (ECF subfamily)
MDRYASGDDAAFAVLYDCVAPRLYGYLIRRTRDAGRAEDLLQQTLLHMHKARGRFVRGAPVLPWMFAIAHRLVVDSQRKGRREDLVEDADLRSRWGGQDEAAATNELLQRLQGVLGELPENQRIVWELLREEGLSHAEAACALGTTVTAVKLRLHRAVKAIRDSLGAELPEGTWR